MVKLHVHDWQPVQFISFGRAPVEPLVVVCLGCLRYDEWEVSQL